MPNWYFIGASFGFGDIDKGALKLDNKATIQSTTTFSDESSEQSSDTSELSAQIDIDSGDLQYFNLDFGATLWSSSKKGKNKIQAFAGYQRWAEEYIQRSNIILTNCVSGDTLLQNCNIESFISNELLFNSIRLGLNGKATFNEFFQISGSVSYIPYSNIEYEEIGESNNSTTNTTSKSEFDRDGTGTGYNFKISIDYEILPLLFLSAGYKFWKIKAKDKVEGTSDSFPLDGLEIERQGFTLGASFRY